MKNISADKIFDLRETLEDALEDAQADLIDKNNKLEKAKRRYRRILRDLNRIKARIEEVEKRTTQEAEEVLKKYDKK